MNIYYLKKFRKEAYNKFGIIKYKAFYVVIYRRSNVWRTTHSNKESAIKSLYEAREKHILELLEDEKQERVAKENEKLNKQLAKL